MKTFVLAAFATMWGLSAMAGQNLPPSAGGLRLRCTGGLDDHGVGGQHPAQSLDVVHWRELHHRTAAHRASTGNLLADANLALPRSFAQIDARPTLTFPAGPHIIRGMSAQGWEYLIVKRGVGRRAGRSGS